MVGVVWNDGRRPSRFTHDATPQLGGFKRKGRDSFPERERPEAVYIVLTRRTYRRSVCPRYLERGLSAYFMRPCGAAFAAASKWTSAPRSSSAHHSGPEERRAFSSGQRTPRRQALETLPSGRERGRLTSGMCLRRTR